MCYCNNIHGLDMVHLTNLYLFCAWSELLNVENDGLA